MALYTITMALAFRSASQNSSSSGSAVSVDKPSGAVTGDTVFVVVQGNGQITISDNNGSTPFTPAPNFTDYKPNTTNGHTMTVFKRKLVDGDPATYNFTLSVAGRWSVDALCFSGNNVDYDVAPNTANAANEDNSDDGSIDAPAITVANNSIHVVFCGWDTSAIGTITTPSGYTLAANANGGGEPLHSSYKVFATGASTGAVTCQNTEFGAKIASSFSVKEASNSYQQTVSETISQTEVLSKASARIVSELSTITASNIKGLLRNIAESITNSPVLSNVPKKVALDSESFSDALSRAPSKRVSESSTISEAITRAIIAIRSETISIAEAISKVLSRIFSEASSIVIAFASSKVTLATLSEVISYADSIIKKAVKTISESQMVSDVFSGIKVALKSISEVITISENLVRNTVRVVGEFVATAIVFLDTAIKKTTRTLSEASTFTETFSRVLIKLLSVVENISFVDTIQRVFRRILSEATSIADTTIAQKVLFQVYKKIRGLVSSVVIRGGIKRTNKH